MSRHGCVNSIGVFIVILLCMGATAMGDQLSLDLAASGDLDAKLQGLSFYATLEGNGTVEGTVSCGDKRISLASGSDVIGVGVYDILNLETKGWILASAAGVTANEQAFIIRSIAYILRQDVTPLKVGDLLEGVHQTIIQIGEVVETYRGSFSGTLTGGLSTTSSSGLLQLVGSGRFTFSGESISSTCDERFPSSIPLDDPDLPAEFLDTISETFL